MTTERALSPYVVSLKLRLEGEAAERYRDRITVLQAKFQSTSNYRGFDPGLSAPVSTLEFLKNQARTDLAINQAITDRSLIRDVTD